MNARYVVVQINGKACSMHTRYLIRRPVLVKVGTQDLTRGVIAGGNAQTGAVVYGEGESRQVVRFTWSALLRAVEHQEILRV